jgi:hypothetical protein
MRQEPPPPPAPPADANYHLKFTYGVNAWRHWVVFKNTQIERNAKPGDNRFVPLQKTARSFQEVNSSLHFCKFLFVPKKKNLCSPVNFCVSSSVRLYFLMEISFVFKEK